MAIPGNHSLCGGDLNCCWDGRPDGVGYAEPLREWADAIGYRSRHSDLPPDPLPFITRPSPSLLGGTEIDHVLHNSPTMTLTQYDTGAAGLWVGLSDHRPVITAYSGLVAKGMRPRFTHAYSQARSLQLPRFRPSVKQLQEFKSDVEANWIRLEGVPDSCPSAEAQLSHLTDISLAASPSRKKWKVRNKYKEHWSPTYAALQSQLVAMVRLQRQLGVLPRPAHLPRWSTPLDVQRGISEITHAWERTVASLTFSNGTPPEVWGTGLTPAEWRTQDVSNLNSLRLAAVSNFKLLKSNLHARKRKELSIRVSVHIASREENIQVTNMHAGIQSLLNELPLNTPLEQLNFGDEDYTPRSPEELHTYMTAMFDRHFQAQPTPSPALHNGTLRWEDIVNGTFDDFRRHHADLHVPYGDGDRPDTLEVLWQALRTSPHRDRVNSDLSTLIVDPPTLSQFTDILHSKSGHSSGGPSGLQYKHIQSWPPAMIEEAYNCLATMWTHRHTPDAWKWKWLVPIPKGTSEKVSDMRPIMLMEVLRKLWTGLIVQRITSSLQKHGALSLNQHGYLPKRGTDTANLQLLNTLETAWDEQRPLYGCSWDMKKAFDSVSKPLILLCWQRLGVPIEIAQWLVDLDEAGFTIVRTPFALERWDLHGLLGLQPLAFNPERGTGQGDIHSPFTWLAVFDVLLTMLENTPTSEHHFLLRKPDGSTYTARDICFADDLQSFGATLEGLQRTADLVSTYAMVFNLSIASHKLRAFHFRGLLLPPLEPLHILVYDPGWVPQRVYLKTEGTFKSLGVEYPINPGDSTSFAAMKLKLIQSLRAISIKKASARAVNVVLSKCLYNRGAYVGVLSSWSLAQCEELDKVFATEIRRRTKNMKTSQLENLFQPASAGGQGYQRLSVIIQQRKRRCLARVLRSGDHWSRWAADALTRRGHRCPHHLQLNAITPQLIRPGFWVSSLISYGWKGNACLTKQTSLPSQRPCPALHHSLVGSPLPGHSWTPSNVKCLHSLHLLTFGDVVCWNRALKRWDWREVNGPKALQGALDSLSLPDGLAAPLLPGQAWHLTPPGFLSATSTITEILHISCTSSTSGNELTVLYRRWHLLNPATSPPIGTILRNPSRPQVYHGSMATHDWFPEIFGSLETEATLITLVTAGTSLQRGVAPGQLSSLALLPLTVEILRAAPYLPPSYIGPLGACPRITSPAGGLFAQSDPTSQHVYMAIHTSTGYSPLHQAVNHGVHRISLTLAVTADHKSWQSHLYCDTLDQSQARPRHQAILLMGILRAVWDHQASDTDSRLILHIPDFSLVQSLRARPASFSSEVTEWLHETVRLILSPSVSLVHTGPTPVLQGAYTSAELGMHLASASARTGISSLLSVTPALASEHGLVDTLSTHALAECFPIGALRDSWTWRDLFTGEPLLVPLEERIQCLRRTQALHTRDLDRAYRLDPPIWADTTMSFAAKVLDLPSLPQGSRAHYEKLLHERHWTVGHNSSKEASSVSARAELLTCSLCASPDRREEDTYDHIFRLCSHPSLLQCRNACNEQLAQYTTTTDLEKRLLPMLTQLVLSPDGHRLCLGNWNPAQLEVLSTVLLPTDSSEAITAVLLDASRVLVTRVDALWEARKQAKYIEAVSSNASADPAVLRILQRKYKPFAPRPIKEPKVFYGVRLGHVPGVYTSWKEAKPHTVGILSDYKRFKTRQKAEEYVTQVTTLGQPLLPSPDVVIYTDGSASLSSGTAGWGVFARRSDTSETSLWGPVLTDPAEFNWIGASRPTNNTGEISAIYHALQWLARDSKQHYPGTPQRVNLLTDSVYCVRLFGDNSIKARCNKPLIQRVCQLLHDVRSQHNLSISWIKAHTGASTPDALGNATADRLAARGRSGSSGVLTQPNLAVRPLRRSRPPSASTDPLRRPKRRKRALASRDPRSSSYPAFSADYLVLYKLARACRPRCSPSIPVFPYGTGDLVGD